jgi:hypothetical protein
MISVNWYCSSFTVRVPSRQMFSSPNNRMTASSHLTSQDEEMEANLLIKGAESLAHH